MRAIRWPSWCASTASPRGSSICAGINPDQPPHITRSVVLRRETGSGSRWPGAAVPGLDMGATKLAAGIGDGRRGDEPTRHGRRPHASEGAESVLARALELAQRVHAEATAAGERRSRRSASRPWATPTTTGSSWRPTFPAGQQLRIPQAVAQAFPGLPVPRSATTCTSPRRPRWPGARCRASATRST